MEIEKKRSGIYAYFLAGVALAGLTGAATFATGTTLTGSTALTIALLCLRENLRFLRNLRSTYVHK